MTLSTVSAQVFDAYEQKIFQKGEQVLPYRMLKPMGDTAATYPLIIFLHGAFEKGTDNQAPLNIGGRFFLRDSI
ncbi:MAG: phospholipase, partial [Chitinophagaceae bacterium]|nr:phospholipase [Chitinophagaceae bacterium]